MGYLVHYIVLWGLVTGGDAEMDWKSRSAGDGRLVAPVSDSGGITRQLTCSLKICIRKKYPVFYRAAVVQAQSWSIGMGI
jgi:hypothetical protein